MSEVDVTPEAPKDTITEPDVTVKPPPEQPPQETKKAGPGDMIPLNKGGMVVPQNANDLWRLARQLLVGKGVPRSYTTVEQVIAGWNFAASLKLPPQVSLRNIAVIEGTPSLFGDLPLALVQRSGELIFFDEFIVDKDYKKICYENKNLDTEPFAGICIGQRKGMEKKSYSFSVEDAKTAGLWGKTSSSGKMMPWKAYPKVMLCRRPRAMMIKTDFADVLSGASIAEYDFNEAPDLRDVTPGTEGTGASILNNKFKDTAHAAVAPGVGEARTNQASSTSLPPEGSVQ